MQSVGLGFGYLTVLILYVVIPVVWITLGVYSLIKLHKQNLNSTAKAIWVLIILVVPIIGAIVYLTFKPHE
jgi:uncharacterized membrane protein YozB (DUF420 family)